MVGEQKVAKAASLATGNKMAEETPLDRLIFLNLKNSRSDSISNRVKKRTKRSPAAVISPSKPSFHISSMAELKQPSTLGAIKGLSFQILVAMRFPTFILREKSCCTWLPTGVKKQGTLYSIHEGIRSYGIR